MKGVTDGIQEQVVGSDVPDPGILLAREKQ
jgi:hypothetical protein